MGTNTRKLLIIIVALLIVAGIFLSLHISRVRSTFTVMKRAHAVLIDSAAEQAATLSAVLEGRFQILNAAVATLSAENTPVARHKLLQDISAHTDFARLALVSVDGLLLNDQNGTINVSDRTYFQKALAGERSITHVVDRMTGRECVVLSVPCMADSRTVSVLIGLYYSDDLRLLLQSKAYGGQGYSCVTDASGKIIVGTDEANQLTEHESIFEVFDNASFAQGNSAESLRRSMSSAERSVLQFTYGGQDRIAIAVPFGGRLLPQNDWILFNLVNMEALGSEVSQGKEDILEGVRLTVVLALVAGLLLFLLAYDSRKKMKKEAALLRHKEEQFRIVADQSERQIFRYDIPGNLMYIAYGTSHIEPEASTPEKVIESGRVARESQEDYRAFFKRLADGESPITMDFLMPDKDGAVRWFRYAATTLFANDGTPQTAVISCMDYTDLRLKEQAWNTWRQEMSLLPLDKTACFEWNLTRDTSDREYGGMSMDFSGAVQNTFDARTDYYTKRHVHSEDKSAYLSLMRRDFLLGMYYSGTYSKQLDYRHVTQEGEVRWQRLSVRLFPYPDTQDVKAYILDQDIDEEKRRELELLEISRRDPLTGALNRTAFLEQVKMRLQDNANEQHALMILDLDGFKKVNDLMGHGTGDKLLTCFVGKCHSMLRPSDLVGRVGGDEFMIFVSDMGTAHAISEKAQRLCEQQRHRLSETLTVSVSIGIAVYPKDGTEFDVLYEKADIALYHAKALGRNRFVLYDNSMQRDDAGGHAVSAADDSTDMPPETAVPETVLVVDDVSDNRTLLRETLETEGYRILEAENGVRALELLHAEQKIDLVLLDLVMPYMDGYEVLERMRQNRVFRELPVVSIIDGNDVRSVEKALACGAADFITRPFSTDILRIRIGNMLDRQRSTRLMLESMALHFRLEQQAESLRLLERDPLTGLLNREAFFIKATEAIKDSTPGSYVIICFDVDGFKVVNDQYGVETGDRLLVHLAKVFRQGFHRVGGFVARISADNFIGIYPANLMGTPELSAIYDNACVLTDPELKVTLSIGQYVVEDTSLPLSAMQDRAKLAKETIKGQYDVHCATYDESMRTELVTQRKIVSEMDEALSSGQFEIWLQGQYNIITGNNIGAEALVRWRHPKDGIISPGVFIPIFEKNGFIYTLDQYVWEQVCILLRRWLDEGRSPLPVSVNVSRCDIFRPDFYDRITGLVERYAIPVNLLWLEITESAFSQSTEQIIDVVKKLRSYGFTLEIDDFGSGYSSLNTLKDVSADILKLDMRFLESDKDSKRGGNILESMVRMGRWLDMSVIAEGVETQQQADFLKSIGCNYVQGYFYARPMPVPEFEKKIRCEELESELFTMKKAVLLDNNAFWNPDSIETLIFNSYVGGAVVMEYSNGNIEILRMNDRYWKETGIPLEANNNVWRDMRSYLTDDIYKKLSDAIEEADRTGEEVSYETGRRMPDGETKYIRSRIRVLAKAPGRLLVYGIVENITPRIKNELAVRASAEQLVFLNSAARKLMMGGDADAAIHEVLEMTRSYFAGTRAYIFEYIRTNASVHTYTVRNTYEVCAEGVVSQIDNLQSVNMDDFSEWNVAFEKKDFFYLPSVRKLDEERSGERKLLEEQDIGSLLAVPLYSKDTLIGFMGVDDPTQSEHAVEHLTAIGDYMAVMLGRRDMAIRLARDNQMLADMMRDMPGGFVRMRVEPDGTFVPLFINDKMVQQLGMSREHLMEIYRDDAFQGVHEGDKKAVRDVLHKALNSGEVFSTGIRLMNGNGGYTSFRVFYRSSTDADGIRYVNGYYTDLN